MLILMAMAAMVVLVSGVAWAATVQCEAGLMVCLGTADPDTITGTSGYDHIRGLEGGDLVRGMGYADIVEGGKGKDTVKGGAGSDYFLWGGEAGLEQSGPFTDASDDYVYGGAGGDRIYGGYAQGGVDHVFGEDGNDYIDTNQRGHVAEYGVVVTKEIVNCGAGHDFVIFDQGKDEVAQNCEDRVAVEPGGAPPAMATQTEGLAASPFK